ncbi:MAG: hypothetical protein EOP22_09730 [Hyphomicrobiales bacterium]|nr:MAG: hypothetical protein EOP22_09730 [Hyphomicrobiales bacterium]
MRDLFRLIAVGLVSFAIVGLAMVYSRGGDASTAFRSISNGVASAVDGVIGTSTAEAPAATGYTLNVARPRAAAWVGIAGFPDQSEIVFPVPHGATYLSGALNLVFDTQLAEHGDGLLTLSVNGTPRGQLVLDSGRHAHQARIELTAADLSSDRLVLQMAGRGTTNSGQICPTDAANSGSAVTLTADSRLELVSAEAPADTIGVLLASPGTLALQPGLNKGDAALAVWANQRLMRAGINARLSEGGPGETSVVVTRHAVTAAGTISSNVLAGEESVTALIAAAGAPLPVTAASGSTSVADLGAETIVKSFRGSRRWTIPFAAADMPNGALPERFSLKLKATPLASGNDWVVRITLNGNLVETYRVAGSADSLDFDIALPPERMLPGNMLAVELVDTTPNQGICTRAPDAQAQLLPESSLLNTSPALADWAALVERIAATSDISFDADGLSLTQAGRASELLALVLPQTMRVRLDGEASLKLNAIARDALPAALAVAAPTAQVLLPVATNAGTSLVLMKPGVELAAALQRLGADDVVLLITG